ncbi:hypothetical protein JNL27_18305, partial [bacterium]|nr:hypothetical protein [bacterium]
GGRAGSSDIYAQRLNAAGIRQWVVGSDSNGFAVSTAVSFQNLPVVSSDDAGGSIIAWVDLRNGGTEIYSQKIDSAGSVQWTANGVAVSGDIGAQHFPVITTVPGGGAIIAWEDATSGANFAQRINSSGTALWTTNGIAVLVPISGPPSYSNPAIVIDNNGYTILAADRSNST